jgi:hypothetical protein
MNPDAEPTTTSGAAIADRETPGFFEESRSSTFRRALPGGGGENIRVEPDDDPNAGTQPVTRSGSDLERGGQKGRESAPMVN